MKSVNMPTQLICIIVLMVIVARTQPLMSLAVDSNKLYSANTSDVANSSVDNTSSSMKMSTPNGNYSEQVSDLFKDLSAYSDKANVHVGTNKTLQINSSNFGPTDVEQDDESSLIISAITANILIFVIGFCGNSLVILVILKFTRIETVTDIYILNLAFADLMFLFGLVFLIITMFLDHWIFGNLMCKLYMASTSLNQFASSLLLVVMSFDRYLAVCHPIYAQRFRRLRRAKIICLCIWIMCLILMTPIFAFAKTDLALRTCAIFWPEYKSFNYERAFTLYSFAIGFAVPLSLIAAFYICVIRKLRIAAKGPIGAGSSRRSRTRETTNRRIEHLVIGIICTYTVCWLPYWIAQLLVSFSSHLDSTPITGFYPFILLATCLSYTNSALNPILYAFLSDNFKRRCSDVFRSIYSVNWCQRPPNQEPHSTVATGLCGNSELHNQNYNCISKNNDNKTNPERVKLRESRQSVVIGDPAVNPTRSSETLKPMPRSDGPVDGDDVVLGSARDQSQDNRAIDSSGVPARDHMIDCNRRETLCNKAQPGINNVQQLQHSDLDRANHQDGISNQHRSETTDCKSDSGGDLGCGYKLNLTNHPDFYESQTTEFKSVVFSIETLVVQGPVNKL